jgi:pyruvate kinase
MEFSEDPEVTIVNAIACLQQKQWCKPGTWLVVITNALAADKIIDTIQLRQVS